GQDGILSPCRNGTRYHLVPLRKWSHAFENRCKPKRPSQNISPDASLPDAKFKVLEGEKASELSMLKQVNSRLALGIFFAREGMIAEAEKEIQILSERNPELPELQRVVRSLRLRQIQ
ncbi:MAG: hypothetical protein ACREEM_05225, partial [Blastocatellia bacterium]